MNKKYLLIGATPTNDPRSYGGTTVLVNQLKNYFDEKKIEYIFIKTNKYTGKFAFLKNYLYVIFCFFKYIKKIDIVFSNVASNGMYFLSPFLLILCKKYNKRFISRIFGGNSIELYENVNKVKKCLIRYLFKNSDILFFEPKYLVNYFKKINPNTYWFPNTRKEPKIKKDLNRKFNKNFIYIGQIKKEKGIDDLLEAFMLIDDSYKLILYGNIIEKKYSDELFSNYSNVEYGGQVNHSEVNNILAKNDVLILPSHREGYPGVIIEAFGVGLPVVATKLPSIQEMIDCECGVLVEVKNSKALANAILKIDSKNFNYMSEVSLSKFENFKYENVYKNIIEKCKEIV